MHCCLPDSLRMFKVYNNKQLLFLNELFDSIIYTFWLPFWWCRPFSSLSLITGFQIGWMLVCRSWDVELTTMLWNLLILFLKWVTSWFRGWGWKVNISLPCIWGKAQLVSFTLLHAIFSYTSTMMLVASCQTTL